MKHFHPVFIDMRSEEAASGRFCRCIVHEESHMKSFGGNFSCDFLTKRYQERVRGRGSTIQTRTICEIVVSHNKIIHQVTVLFVIILSIIFGFVNRQNDKKITKFL